MTALERLLRAHKPLELASGSDTDLPMAIIAQGSTPNPDVLDVDKPTNPEDLPQDQDVASDISDSSYDAVLKVMNDNAEAIGTSVDIAGAYSDLQTALVAHDEGRAKVAIYQLRLAQRMSYTSRAADAAVNTVVGRVTSMLAGGDDDQDDNQPEDDVQAIDSYAPTYMSNLQVPGFPSTRDFVTLAAEQKAE